MNKYLMTAMMSTMIATTSFAASRNQINIVGSSTVFPFATAVAEKFGNKTKFKTPKIESTGSGGGFKLFCKGLGAATPDITNASRRMKRKEWNKCQQNSVTQIVEFMIGYDGIVVGTSKKGPDVNFSRAELFKGLNSKSTATKWSDVNPALPNINIRVIGPPPTSGTRDAFEELVMQKGCVEAGGNKKQCKKTEIRTDGRYIEGGENDNLIVSKLRANPDTFGIFGFSFLDQNRNSIKGATVDNVPPTFEKIASSEYSVSRSLYFYVKKDHVTAVPGIKEFVREFVSRSTLDVDGYLVEKGLIPPKENDLIILQKKSKDLTVMTGKEDLH